MKNDISAIGNALVDTVFKVEHNLISELGLEIDQMTLSSAEEHAPITVSYTHLTLPTKA